MSTHVANHVRNGVVSAALVLTSCGEYERLWIEPFDLAGAESVVLFVEQKEQVEAYAFDASFPIEVEVAVPPQRITVLLYRASLSDLELSAGRIDFVAHHCDLQHPIAAYRAEDKTWSQITDVEGYLSFLLPNLSSCTSRACVTFEQTMVEMGTSHRISSIAAYDDETALVVDAKNNLLKVTRRTVEVLSAPLQILPRRVYVSSDRTVWIAGQGAEVVRGPLDGPFELIRTASTSDRFSAMLETASGNFLGFVSDSDLDRRLVVDRYDGVQWKRLFERSVQTESSRRAQLVEGNGLVLANAAAEIFLVIDGDQVSMVDTTAISGGGIADHFESLRWTHGFGFVVGSTFGDIFGAPDPRGDDWQKLGDDRLQQSARLLLPIDQGVLAFVEIGEVRQIHPGQPECPSFYIPIEPHQGAVVGEGLVVGGESAGSQNRVIFLDRRPNSI